MGSKLRSILFLTGRLQYTSPLLYHNLHLLLFNPFSTSSKPISHSERKLESPSESHENSTSLAHTTIAQYAISKFTHIWEKKADSCSYQAPLQSMIWSGFDLSPETLRPLLRATELKPQHFLEIVLGFGDGLNVREVTYLWKLFRWCELQREDFQHLSRSYEIVISLLTSAQMLYEAKSLISSTVRNNILLSDYGALFNDLIQAYAGVGKVDDSMYLFDQARGMGLVLSGSSYNSLLDSLIKIPNAELVVRVYRDMIDVGLGSYSQKCVLDFVVINQANSGMFLEAVRLIRLLKNLGIEPGQEAVSTIAEGYCMKKDFGDMMNFIQEQAVIPKTEICNKMVNSLCINLGSEEAWIFLQKMENRGFRPDAGTFGNLICQSCKDGNVRDAFIFFSECASRKIMPRVYFYNSIIGGIFKKRMYRHVSYVYDDMLEKGLQPDLCTFKILLAGYCKYRKLDEVEKLIDDVNNAGIIFGEKGGCFFSKAMSILGLGHLGVKLRRDNSMGFQKAEFFDSLGNGLYLDMDIDEFERCLDEVLDLAMVPNLDSVVISELKRGNVRNALEARYDAVQLGRDLSLEAYRELLICLCGDEQYLSDAVRIVEEMPELCDNLDSETLNLAIRFFSENKMARKAHLLLERLISREMLVERDTYSSRISGFCEERDFHGFKEAWDLAKRGNWSPKKKEIQVIFGFLCRVGAVRENLELLDSIERYFPRSSRDAYKVLIKLLCSTGYTDFACAIVEAILNNGLVWNNSSLLYLIKGFIKEKKSAEAHGLFEIWLERKGFLDAATFQLVLPLILKFGCVEDVFCLVQPPRQISQNFLLELCLRRKMKEANSFVKEMIRLNNLHSDETCLNALLQGYCRENNFKKNALEILCCMLRKGASISISGYRALISQMCADQTYEKALNLSNIFPSKNRPSDVICKNILIFNLFHMRSESLVERVLTEMQQKGIDHDKVTCDFLLYGYHKCGNMAKSIDAFDGCISKGFDPSNRSIRIVMSYFCTRGNLDNALELLNLTKINKWKCGSLIVITLGLSLISSDRCLEAAHICDEAPENLHFDPLMRHFCMKGEIKTAISLVNKMLKRGNVPSEITYSGVIYLLCHCREIDAALAFLTEMELRQLMPNKKSCETLIGALCDIGKLHDARLLLDRMVGVGMKPSYEIYNLVLKKYQEVKDMEMAAEITREMQKAGYKPKFEMQWSIISELCSSADKSGRGGKPILSRVLSSGGMAQLKKLKG
ncbi:Pentatricopeptide repeat-containing protein [Rhynchospora pubera]|uniref:Pentatricopeptide repeat-containing protein n=2 Tax=Rhynchospora pubera TaxID=906938 RepID=A0AAV8HX63_9POAL|nr:Pentatricopeptide repeat-containing protein [Rhynchospora pubera]